MFKEGRCLFELPSMIFVCLQSVERIKYMNDLKCTVGRFVGTVSNEKSTSTNIWNNINAKFSFK